MNIKGRIVRLERKRRSGGEFDHMSDAELVARIQYVAGELKQGGDLDPDIAAILETAGLWEARP